MMTATTDHDQDHDSADDQLDRLFQALANRNRRAILTHLERGPAKITDLAELFDMTLPAVSKNVRVLEHAGLVKGELVGRLHRCRLDADGLADLAQWVEHYRAYWDGTLDALAGYANRQAHTK